MASTPATSNAKKAQDFTTKLPMVDLETSITQVIVPIREKALETAAMPMVAKALGYSSPTSTPFYKRMIAARLFNLLSQKSALTQAASDYIRPHDEGTKATVLKNAILGIGYYKHLVNIYAGKKINVALVANLISKEQHLTDECAAICAKTFEASLRFAGMISADGIVELSGSPTAQEKKVDPNTSGASVTNTNSFGPSDQDESGDTRNTHRHVLFLDRNKSRQFAFSGPLEITQAEFERICKWLEFTMLIVSETKEVNHERPNNGARDGE